MEFNCMNCKFLDIEKTEYSKFFTGYVRFGCQLKGMTNWVYTLDKYDQDKFICEKHEVKNNG